MRMRSCLRITIIVQGAYALLIALNVLSVWLFVAGIADSLFLAYMGNVILLLIPVASVCLVINLITFFGDTELPKAKKNGMLAVILLSYIFLCVLKFFSLFYGMSHLGGVI